MAYSFKNKLCRLCLCSDVEKVDIFRDQVQKDFLVQDVIEDLIKMKVVREKEYPWLVCQNCLTKLNDFNFFKQRCVESQFVFRNRTSTSDLPCEENWEVIHDLEEIEKVDVPLDGSDGSTIVLIPETAEYSEGEDIESADGRSHETLDPLGTTVKSEVESPARDDNTVTLRNVRLPRVTASKSVEEDAAVEKITDNESFHPRSDEATARPAVELGVECNVGAFGKEVSEEILAKDYGIKFEVESEHSVDDTVSVSDGDDIGYRGKMDDESLNQQPEEVPASTLRETCEDSNAQLEDEPDDVYSCYSEGGTSIMEENGGEEEEEVEVEDMEDGGASQQTQTPDAQGAGVEGEANEQGGNVPEGDNVRNSDSPETAAPPGGGGTPARGRMDVWRLYKCPICPRSLRQSKMKAHLASHSRAKEHKCSVCGECFKQRAQLEKHEMSHTGVKQFFCDKCPKLYRSKSGLMYHLMKHDSQPTQPHPQPPKPNTCDICSLSCPSRSALMLHLRAHTAGKTFTCDICSISFNRKLAFDEHVKHHVGNRPYPCNKCSKSYTSKSGLEYHKLRHEGKKPLKPHACQLCPATFMGISALTVHLRVHTGERPFSCDICSKSFKFKGSLKTHLITHTQLKPFTCSKCSKSYRSKNSMKLHMLSHYGIKRSKPYACDMCSGSFVSRSALNIHLRTHTGEKPFSCNICSKSFAQKAGLNNHMANHRGGGPLRGGKYQESHSSKESIGTHMEA